MSDHPIYADDDDFSQLHPDDDDFVEDIPDEAYIEVEDVDDIKEQPAPVLERPKFSMPLRNQETAHEKAASQIHRQESLSPGGSDAAGDAPLPPAEAPAEDAAEEVITYRYRIALVLSPEVETQVKALRQAVNLPDAEIGILTLLPDFRTDHLDDVQEILEEWVQDHLPLETTLESIEARTIGSQRYLAAWQLSPAEPILQAQEALSDNLSQYITLEETGLPFQSRLIIADHTPPKIFPRLVREMQTQFERLTWQMDTLELLRAPEADARWEVLEKFV
jgi:hypothetical protein